MKRLFSVLFSLLVVLSSCKDETESSIQPPKPVLPPEYSMAPNFEDFQNDGSQRNQTMENWLYSAVNVSVYSSLLAGGLAVPTAAFKATISQEPVYDGDAGVWVWTSNFTVNSEEYEVSLTAAIADQIVSWNGFVNTAGASTQGFNWFQGGSDLDGNAGAWVLFESPQNPAAWISTDWSRNEDRTEANATFTIQKEGDLLDSYIDYSRDENSDFNRSVEISNTKSGDLIMIDWNSDSKVGRVKSENYFDDAEYHCWDENFQDTSCE